MGALKKPTSAELDKAWKNRPIHYYTGLSRTEYNQIMDDPVKRKRLEKYLNVVLKVVRELKDA